MGKLQDGTTPWIDFEVGAAPATPAAGIMRVYAKTGDSMAQKDDAGAETLLDAAGGGGGSGALVFLDEQVASGSATLDFTGFISGTYDEYVFEFINLIPATNAVEFWMRMGTGGGPTYDTGNNYSDLSWRCIASGAAQAGSTGVSKIRAHGGVSADLLSDNTAWGLCGSLRLFSPQSTSLYKQVEGHTRFFNSASERESTQVSGAYESTTAVTAVRFLMSSGNI